MAELVSHKLEVVNVPGGIPAKTVTWGNPAGGPGASGTVDFPAKDTRQLQAAAQPGGKLVVKFGIPDSGAAAIGLSRSRQYDPMVIFGLQSSRDNYDAMYTALRDKLIAEKIPQFRAAADEAAAQAIIAGIQNDARLKKLDPVKNVPPFDLVKIAKKAQGEFEPQPFGSEPRPLDFASLIKKIRTRQTNTLGLQLLSPSIFLEKEQKFVSRLNHDRALLASSPDGDGIVAIRAALDFMRMQRTVRPDDLPYMIRAQSTNDFMTNKKLRNMIVSGRFPYDPDSPYEAVPYIYAPRVLPTGEDGNVMRKLKSERMAERRASSLLSCEPLFTDDEMQQYMGYATGESDEQVLRQVLPKGAPFGTTGDIGRFISTNNESAQGKGVGVQGVPDPTRVGVGLATSALEMGTGSTASRRMQVQNCRGGGGGYSPRPYCTY